MQADKCLRILRSIAVDLASELDLHYTTRELRNISPIIDHLRESFEVLEQETEERVPAIEQIVNRHDDEADAEEEDAELDLWADPMFGSIHAYRIRSTLSEEVYGLICQLLAEFSRHLYVHTDDATLREEWTVVSAIEEARRMLYVMERRAPMEVEQLLARHFKLMLETTIAQRR